MENLLNRGLNFSVLPDRLNLVQVLVDLKKFERTMLWTEFWAGQTKDEYQPPLFKHTKRIFPENIPYQLHSKICLLPQNPKFWIQKTEIKADLIYLQEKC